MAPKSRLSNLHPLWGVAWWPAMLAVWYFFTPDSLWGRPISDDAALALYVATTTGPGLAFVLAAWGFQQPSEATARLSRLELVVGRTPLVVFLLAPLLWSLCGLCAWYDGAPALPDAAIYLCGGVQLLAYVSFLAIGVFVARRRNDLHALSGIVG